MFTFTCGADVCKDIVKWSLIETVAVGRWDGRRSRDGVRRSARVRIRLWWEKLDAVLVDETKISATPVVDQHSIGLPSC